LLFADHDFLTLWLKWWIINQMRFHVPYYENILQLHITASLGTAWASRAINYRIFNSIFPFFHLSFLLSSRCPYGMQPCMRVAIRSIQPHFTCHLRQAFLWHKETIKRADRVDVRNDVIRDTDGVNQERLSSLVIFHDRVAFLWNREITIADSSVQNPYVEIILFLYYSYLTNG